MAEQLPTSTFGKATIFESGYLHGYAQSEVRTIRFLNRVTSDGNEYPAAVFVRKGNRKEETVDASRIVAVLGWGLPEIETDTVERLCGTTVHSAKFQAFAPAWNVLLDDYLSALRPPAEVIFDGRRLPKHERITRRTHNRTPANVAPRAELPASVTPQLIEGALESILVDRFERDPEARRACIDHYGYGCRVCGVKMSDVYGDRGKDFIHVHHRTPLSEIRESYVVDPIADLIPVCPNCHAMLHRGETTLEVEELAEIVRNQRSAQR